MFGNIFFFYFQKLVSDNIKKNYFLLFLKLKTYLVIKKKKKIFQKKGIENTKVYRYQDLNFNANLLNEINSLN